MKNVRNIRVAKCMLLIHMQVYAVLVLRKYKIHVVAHWCRSIGNHGRVYFIRLHLKFDEPHTLFMLDAKNIVTVHEIDIGEIERA